MYYCHAKINCIFIIVESNPKENSNPSSSSEVLGSSPQVPSSSPQVPGSSSQVSSSISQVISHSISEEVTDSFPEKHVHHHDICKTKCFESSKSSFVLVLLKKKTKKPTSCNIAGLRIKRCHTVKQQTYGGQFSQKERVYIVTFVENMIQ